MRFLIKVHDDSRDLREEFKIFRLVKFPPQRRMVDITLFIPPTPTGNTRRHLEKVVAK